MKTHHIIVWDINKQSDIVIENKRHPSSSEKSIYECEEPTKIEFLINYST